MSVSNRNGIPFAWGTSRPFNDQSGYLKRLFGCRIQKLSVDAGFTCPNRDGSKGSGGCTFCNNSSFSPSYCGPGHSVTEQLRMGMAFFSGKYPDNMYLAYFQAYTNTYAPKERLIPLYEEALSQPGIAGLVIGTRPDCVDESLLDYFAELSQSVYVSIEYGIESTKESTLIRINRGHSYTDSVDAINATASRGIHTGGHLIVGLPGEVEQDILEHINRINQLPVTMIKFHQLQIIRGTVMEKEYTDHPGDFIRFTVDSYIDLIIRLLEILRPDIVVERFASVAPPALISTQRWGLKNFELVARLEREMINRKTWQGRLFTLD
ncbi:MAG: TIGR01212 family radical SAM protein [Bacteroidetes bacterium GWF2_49_14]|nr:MAG: TIGR01212 family radical SAM protein [Bacteroidetes bacterium GWF2_49_14]HBB92730.1 TIGR01212 family radical SAM protein [Bacteroidales bacterium]